MGKFPIVFGRILSWTFFFLVQSSFLILPQALGNESVSSFQREILGAKEEKHQIFKKIETVQVSFEREKAASLRAEVDRLLEELSLKSPQDLGPSSREIKPAPGGSGGPVKKVGKASPYARAAPISEGEALYKVAVSDGKVTLKEALSIGLANNLLLQSAKKKIDVARAKLTEARRALFPTVQAVIKINGGIASGRFFKGESKKLNVNQPVYYGGELMLTVKQSEANWKSSKEEYRKARNEFIHQVRTSYYGALKAEYNAQYQTGVYEEVDVIHRRVKEEHRQKLVAEVERLNIESQSNQAFFNAETAKNDITSAYLTLRQAINVPPDKPLPISLKLDFKKLSPDYNEIMEIAAQSNPDVQIKRYALESALCGVEIYQAKKRPRIDLRGSYGMLGEAHHDTTAFEQGKASNDLEKEWFLGVTTSMPLGPNSVEYNQIKRKFGPTIIALTGSEDWNHEVKFNLFDRLSDITDEKSAQATLFQSQGEFEAARNNLTVLVKDNFYNLQKSFLQIDSSMARLRYQEKQIGVTRYLISLQEQNPSDLIERLIDQASNRFSLIQAVADYHLAISNLNLALGDPYYFETDS